MVASRPMNVNGWMTVSWPIADARLDIGVEPG